MPEEMVTITKKEYESLKEDEKYLRALQNAGVDNWSGMDFAMELLREDEES
jgi:phage pi2 protein 07